MNKGHYILIRGAVYWEDMTKYTTVGVPNFIKQALIDIKGKDKAQ